MKTHKAALPAKSSAVLSIALFLALFWLAGIRYNDGLFIASVIWIFFISVMAYRIFVTGYVGGARSLFFIILAWAFIVQFKANLIGLSGRAFVTSEIQEAPYCHIAIAASFLNHVYQQYLALMSGAWHKWSPITWGALWLLVTLVLGQAWCSWACFYGGLDSGFARVLKRPLLKWERLPRLMREMPAAILLAMLLISLAVFQPIFCLWICPLKIGTGFLDPNSAVRITQLIIFASIGIIFLIAAPILTRKRTFCALICPFGAWQAFFGHINPYRVTIKPEACIHCKLCIKACPTFAIDEDDLKNHRVMPYCNRCGECMDVCATGAIDYTIGWRKPLSLATGFARTLFLLSAWLVAGSISLLFVPEVLLKFWRSLTH